MVDPTAYTANPIGFVAHKGIVAKDIAAPRKSKALPTLENY